MSRTLSSQPSADDEKISQLMHKARVYDEKLNEEFAGREDVINELENEIIKHYSNPSELHMPKIIDPIACQLIFTESTRFMGRITEIWNESASNLYKLKATRNTIMDGLLPLMSGGSADAREAKARSCMECINRLITLEEGLILICESAQKNIKSAQEMASRSLKAIELEIIHFNGAEAMRNIVESSRNNRGFSNTVKTVNYAKELLNKNV